MFDRKFHCEENFVQTDQRYSRNFKIATIYSLRRIPCKLWKRAQFEHLSIKLQYGRSKKKPLYEALFLESARGERGAEAHE